MRAALAERFRYVLEWQRQRDVRLGGYEMPELERVLLKDRLRALLERIASVEHQLRESEREAAALAEEG
jgi:hypothetical protein